MRKPTSADAELLLRLYELRRESELRRARKWFLAEFQPAGWDEISATYLSHSDQDRWFRMTISYWEMVATLVNRDLLHAELFFDHTGEDIVTWKKCEPWIAGVRAAVRPAYLCQFERLVRAHLAYRARVNAAFIAAQDPAGAPSRSRRPAGRATGPAGRSGRAATARGAPRGAAR
jgi:hypothetical protein